MLYRHILDLAIPEGVYDAIPLAKKQAARNVIRWLKTLSVKINEGQPNEEDTTRAVWQKCYHDEGKPCGPWQDI